MSGDTKRRIGLTGGIGAGKSTVSDRLRAKGIHVVDADEVARKVVSKGEAGLRALITRFGDDILTSDGSLDRKKLGAIVFSDEVARRDLNAILHPIIIERMKVDEGSHKIVIWDVPLLIEANMHEMMDEVWLVDAPEDVRIARIMLRDACLETEARARMKAQMSSEDKRTYANVVLDNSGDLGALFEAVDDCIERIKKDIECEP